MLKLLAHTIGALIISMGMATADLIGFYPFDDVTNPQADATKQLNDLTVGDVPPAYDSTGGFTGGAYHFNATGRFVIPINPNPVEKPQLTLGAWVKTDTLDPGLYKIMGSDDGGWDRTIGLDNREPDFAFRYTSFTGDGPPVEGTPGPESVDEWAFVAAVYDEGTAEVTVYVDSDASTTDDELGPGVTEPTGFGDGTTVLGLGSISPVNNGEGWRGFIDNVFVFDEALDAAGVEALRDGGPQALYAIAASALPSENLAAFYSFDDGASPMTDDSGNGNDLTSAGVDPAHSAAGGIEGGGYDFDGTQRLIVPVNVNPDVMPKMTMGAWVKTASLDPGLRKVLGSDDGGWDRTIGLDNREPDFAFRYTAFVGNAPPVAGTPGPVSADDWTFLAASHDQNAGTVTVFVDLDASTTDDMPVAVTAPASFGNGPGTLALGGVSPNNSGEAWLGAMDNVFIYDTTLSIGQIVTLRNEGKAAILHRDDPNIVVDSTSPFGDLGQVSGAVARSVSVSNGGAAGELEISSAAVVGQHAGLFSVVSFPGSLDAGLSGDVMIAFDPAGSIGAFEATLVLTSNDPSNPVARVDLAASVSRGLDGLIGLYLFDNPSNPLIDETLAGKDLQSGGVDPSYESVGGVTGGAYSFDGTQRLVAPININPSEQPELTMGAWVKTSTLDPGLRKVIGSDDGGWDRTIGLDNREPDFTFRYTSFVGNAPPVAATPAPVNTDDWTFFAATFSQDANEVTVYVDLDSATTDDPLVAVAGPTGFGPGTSTTAIGGINPGNANEAWLGHIDNVFFFNRVLDSDELTEIRDGGSAVLLPVPTIPTDKLLGYYSFDDPANPTRDLSGMGNDLDATLAEPTYTETGGFNAGAYEFDGSQRLVAAIDINPTEHPKLTMGAWVKTSNLTPGLRKVMGHDDGDWDRAIGLDNREPDNTFRYTSFTGTGSQPVPGTPSPANTDDWTFLATVYDEDVAEVTVYVDLDASTVGDPIVAVADDGTFGSGLPDLAIGALRADNGSEGWVGFIDNAFIFADALSQEQITLLRDLGSAFPPPDEDPDLQATLPPLGSLNRDPAVQAFSIGVSNGGVSEILTISGATIVGADADRFAVTAFPDSLAPQTSGEITFTFDSKGEVGSYEAVIEINSNDPSQPSQRLTLRTTVVSPDPLDPVLIVDTTDPFAGLVANPGIVTRQVMVSNTGATLPLTISGVDISGAAAVNYSVVSSPAEPIAPGAMGVFEVRFDPAGEAGRFAASLDLVSTNASGRRTVIDITAVVPLDPNNLEQALIGFWSFDDPDDPTRDDSGKGKDLEMDGADPAYGGDVGFDGSGAFEFFGAEHLIAPISVHPSEEPEMTWGAWVKATDLTPALRKVLGSDNGGWDRTIGLDSRVTEGFGFTSFHGGGVLSGVPAPEDEDAWALLATSYDQGNQSMTVFLDLDASTTDDDVMEFPFEGTTFVDSLDTFAIGSLRPDNTSEAWIGFIDNPFVYRAVLTAEDITNFRDAGSPLPGAGGPGSGLGFRITEVSIGEDGSVTLSWDGASKANATVILEASADLIIWDEVADGIEEKTVTIPTPVDVFEIYYRVTLEP